MSSRSARVKGGLRWWFALWCALLVAGAQARTLSRRIHKSNQGDNRLPSSLDKGSLLRGRHHREGGGAVGRHRQDADVSLDEATRTFIEDQERYLEKLLAVSSGKSNHAMRKRHDRGSGNALYVKMKDSHMDAFKKNPVSGEYYEVEVKEAQNSSLCNYTVEAIPDRSADRSRTPKDLVNVKCNHLGSSCPHVDTHCCIQTYSTIDTSYANGTYETIKIYTGCVCSLMAFAELAPAVTKKPRFY